MQNSFLKIVDYDFKQIKLVYNKKIETKSKNLKQMPNSCSRNNNQWLNLIVLT